jgi:hypothetical protein
VTNRRDANTNTYCPLHHCCRNPYWKALHLQTKIVFNYPYLTVGFTKYVIFLRMIMMAMKTEARWWC